MKRIALLLVVLVVVGCEDDSNNHGYGYEYDYTTALGIKVRNDASTDSGIPTSQQIDSAFVRAAECLGVDHSSAHKLMIVFVADYVGSNPRVSGAFMEPPPLIVEEPYATQFYSALLLEHEIVHFISWATSGASDLEHTLPCYPPNTIAR